TIVLDEIEKGKASKAKPTSGVAKPADAKSSGVVKPASGAARQETPKFRSKKEKEVMKPKREGGLKRFFRRKAI
ncbi:hypothetical protein IIB97_02055, partial [Patescibacteria group bacterium]|nr:hypothetical protein [Patescibacteria group bacterium]